MKKLIVSASTLLAVIAIVAGVTTAFYGDLETSSGNTLSAGEIDLGIDNTSYYNGALNPFTSWDLTYDVDDLLGPSVDENGVRTYKYLFFNFFDLKPGDWGEDTISLHVKDNEAWACMEVDLTSNNDNGLTDPEAEVDSTDGAGNGELQNFIQFVWWADDGDNVLEDDEVASAFVDDQPLADADDFKVNLADSTGDGILSNGPLAGDTTYYIGKAWCFGELALAPVAEGAGVDPTVNDGITCDGSGLDNSTQTDSVTGDISFTVVQERHSPGFKCEEGGVGCLGKADVMLVLDRSGSVSNIDPDGGGPLLSELQTLKNAAKAFVNALAPSADGVHVGMVSFSTTATLNTHLTDNGTAVNTAIDGLTSTGWTNLQHGIKLARIELENPGDSHDRPDGESPDIMVIITDGEPNRCTDAGASCSTAAARAAAKTQADLAKAALNEIFGVGVGISPSNATFMKNDIVSPPSATHYFDAALFGDLETILENIAQCDGEPG